MTRRDRIVILLEHYVDVLEGVHDELATAEPCPEPCKDWARLCRVHGCAKADGKVLALMCKAWNHPSYRELERLRLNLRLHERVLYWHLAETYFRTEKRRLAVCPKCGSQAPARMIDELCNHGKRFSKTTRRVPRLARVIRSDVEPVKVSLAIDWLDRNWRRGDASIPDDLRPDRAEKTRVGAR